MRRFTVLALLVGCYSTKSTPATEATPAKTATTKPSCASAAVAYATFAVGKVARRHADIPDVGVRLYEPVRNVAATRCRNDEWMEVAVRCYVEAVDADCDRWLSEAQIERFAMEIEAVVLPVLGKQARLDRSQ
jgi:hypothetical protein